MSEAQAKANEKYRKANVKSFNVKFFPADADVLAYFQAKENRNQYIKDLIRKDMERSTTDRQDMYSVQRNILPGRSWDVRTAPKSLPQNRATALPAVARTPDTEVSPGLFRHLCSRGQAPRRPAWRGRSPLP